MTTNLAAELPCMVHNRIDPALFVLYILNESAPSRWKRQLPKIDGGAVNVTVRSGIDIAQYAKFGDKAVWISLLIKASEHFATVLCLDATPAAGI